MKGVQEVGLRDHVLLALRDSRALTEDMSPGQLEQRLLK